MSFWDPTIIDALTKCRLIILRDNTGFGKSEGKILIALLGRATLVIDLLRALKIKLIDLLRISMGSGAAHHVAERKLSCQFWFWRTNNWTKMFHFVLFLRLCYRLSDQMLSYPASSWALISLCLLTVTFLTACIWLLTCYVRLNPLSTSWMSSHNTKRWFQSDRRRLSETCWS